jgi:hypothetical protein
VPASDAHPGHNDIDDRRSAAPIADGRARSWTESLAPTTVSSHAHGLEAGRNPKLTRSPSRCAARSNLAAKSRAIVVLPAPGTPCRRSFFATRVVDRTRPSADPAAGQARTRCADSFADAGFVPVIDDVVVSPNVLELYLTRLKTRPLRLIQLTPTLDVIQRRDANRDKQVFDLWSHLNDDLHNRMPQVGLWLDSSDLTEDQTVHSILDHFDDALVAQ